MPDKSLKQSYKIHLFIFKTFIIVYVLIDFIRRFADGSKVLLMSLDIIIITIMYLVVNSRS